LGKAIEKLLPDLDGNRQIDGERAGKRFDRAARGGRYRSALERPPSSSPGHEGDGPASPHLGGAILGRGEGTPEAGVELVAELASANRNDDGDGATGEEAANDGSQRPE
jgi:hypothetical protein